MPYRIYQTLRLSVQTERMKYLLTVKRFWDEKGLRKLYKKTVSDSFNQALNQGKSSLRTLKVLADSVF